MNDILEKLKKKQEQIEYNEKYYAQLEKEKEELENKHNIYTKLLDLTNQYIEHNFNRNIDIINNYVTDLIRSNFNVEFKLFIEKNSRSVTVKSYIREIDQTDEFHDIIDSNGGGLYDFVSLILRLLFFTKTNNIKTIFIDEPFKNVSHLYRESILLLFKDLIDMLNIQVVMITHDSAFIDVSNQVVVVGHKPDSVIEEIENIIGKKTVRVNTNAKIPIEDNEAEELL